MSREKLNFLIVCVICWLSLIDVIIIKSSAMRWGFGTSKAYLVQDITSNITTTSKPSLKLELTTKKIVDYLAVEEESEEVDNEKNISTNDPKVSPFLEKPKPEELSTQLSKSPLLKNIIPFFIPSLANPQDSAAGVISNMSDIVKLVRFVLLRGHIVLYTHRVMIEQTLIERLMDYLHDIQLRRGKHRILPMEDRDLACDSIPDSKLHLKELCKASTFDCLSAEELIQMLPKSIAFHQAITRICPLLLFRQSRPICVADAKKLLDFHMNKKIQLVEPSIERVWGFGVLFVTISILVSSGGLILLPFLKKSSRTTILTFFEGLAVGGLCGSAILHLFPQAFDIVDEKYRAFFWNTSAIFLGIYVFYCIEVFVKIKKTYYNKNKRKRIPSVVFREEDIFDNYVYQSSPNISGFQSGFTSSPAESEDDFRTQINSSGDEAAKNSNEIVLYQLSIQSHGSTTANNKAALLNSTRDQLVQCLSTVNVMPPPVSINQRNVTSVVRRSSKEKMVRNIALQRQDHETANVLPVDTVAWMIILGDALLNFIDGLSIGAAFDRNILGGMSISVAVMLEEVTHRLGTFAVLIRAGMSMKQSFLYVFLSACACYPGLALGIFLGDEAEDASPYIFALSGGFFLYMALVDVMKAMTRTMENASRKNLRSLLHIFALQNVGIVLSAISLALLAFYEREMDFEVQEIDEIQKNSFV